jgi:hypothetical protein
VSAEALAGAGLVTLVPIWIAALLLSRQPRPVFWFTCALIMVGAGYLIATGAAEDIGRFAGRFVSDKVKETNDQARAATCRGDHIAVLGVTLILGPIFVPLSLILMFKYQHRPALHFLVGILATICFLALAMTPIPERLARSVLPEKDLKVPAYCAEPKS